LAADATGEAESGPLRMQFDRSVKIEFRGTAISSDGGLLLHRELDDAVGLTDMASDLIADPRTGSNGRHRLAGLFRQSVFSRLAGYAYASWQKGGVENAIGRLRRWLPRQTNLDDISDEDMLEIVMTYNLTPRKCLGYITPLRPSSKTSEKISDCASPDHVALHAGTQADRTGAAN